MTAATIRIEHFLDMGRTATNVLGNAIAGTVGGDAELPATAAAE